MSRHGAETGADPATDVSVVIPTFRRPDALRATLAALSDVDFASDRYEVIVVDDGSDDATRKAVEDAGGLTAASLHYVPQPNAGVATARNRGAELAGGDLLIFLDDDMIVGPGHIREHLATQEAYGPALVNGHWEFAPDVRRVLEKSPFGRFRLDVEDWVKDGIAKEPLGDGCVVPATVTAANLSIRAASFRQLGGFDESFPFAGAEDQEFSARAVEADMPLVYNWRIALLHNDNRLTLRQFGRRQEQGALTSIYLASKRPDEYARPLIRENAPISRGDGPRLITKKLVKKALSTNPMLELAHAAVAALERVRPQAQVLRRAYWSICGLYIYRGVHRGLATVAGEDRAGRTAEAS